MAKILYNAELRDYIRESKTTLRQIAGLIGRHPNTVSLWLATPISSEHESMIRDAVKRLKD